MRFKTTVFLALLLVALVTYYWVVERPRQESGDPRPLILHVKPEDVTAVTLEGGGRTVRLVREKDDVWRMEQPVQAPVDKIEMENLLNRVTDLRFDRALGKVDRPGDYGLKNPRQRVILETRSGKKAVLLMGDDAPVGGRIYAMNQESGEAGVASVTLEEMAPDPFKWRDKKVLRFERDKLAEIRIRKGGRRVRLVREDGIWWVGEAKTLRADPMAVQGVILDLSGLKATGFPEAGRARGSRETLRVQLAYSPGEAPAATLIVRKDRAGNRYATVEGNPVLFQIAPDALQEVKAAEDAYYERVILPLVAFDVRRMEIAPKEGAAFVLVRKGDTWSVEGKPDLVLDQERVRDLRDRLLGLKWKRVASRNATDLAPYGLASPAYAVVFKNADGKEMGTLHIGKRRGGRVWVKEARSRAVFVAPASELGDLPETPEALKAEPATPSPEPPASQAEPAS